MLKDVLLELKKAGKTILFSTHRMDQVERLCDAICLIDHGRSILEGELKKIKASYGKNHVQMQYEGDPRLEQCELVESFNNYGNYVEVRLKPGADAQQLLRRAPTTRASAVLSCSSLRWKRFSSMLVVKMQMHNDLAHRPSRIPGARSFQESFLLFTLLMPGLMAGSILIPAKLAEIKSGGCPAHCHRGCECGLGGGSKTGIARSTTSRILRELA